MIFFIVGILAILIGLVVLIALREPAGIAGIVIGAVAIIISCATVVPAQSVGVVTQFSKPTGTDLGPGFHWKAPWYKVTDMDGTTQSLNNAGSGGDDKDGTLNEPATPVRMLVTNSIATVESNLRWKIVPDSSPQLYLDWKKGSGNIVEDKVARGLVDKQLKAALSNVLASYDPLLAGTTSTDPEETAKIQARLNQQSNPELSKKVVEALNASIGKQIQIISFSITGVNYDDKTQDRINQLQIEVSNTRAAEQREKTAAADARANRALSSSVSNDPNVLVSRCLAALDRMVDKGQAVPPAFSCWPGTNTQVVTPTN